MKKILLILLSVLCVLISPMTMFADELTDLEKIAQGKGGDYKVGDVLTLPIDTQDNGEKAIAKDADFLVIGKDEDYQNTLTLMSIEPLTIYEKAGNYVIKDGELSTIETNLKNGTYSGTPALENLVGYQSSMFFKTLDDTNELSIDNSAIKAFSNFYSKQIKALGKAQVAFESRIINANKDYVLKDGTTGTLNSKFWLPSLKELGYDVSFGNTNAYSLFTSKNVMTYLNEKGLDTSKALKMFTRDLDYENNGIYVIDHNETLGYKKQTNVYEPVNFGVCFTVTYDEEITEYKNPTGDNNVLLYANKPSTYYVLMPKKVYVQSEQTTPFNLIVYGEIETTKEINIEIPDTVVLENKSGSRTGIELDIDADIDPIDYDAIDDGKRVVETIEVTAPKIYAGSWEVNLPISISLDE